MAQARRVFSDLTNNAEDALTLRSSGYTSKAGDASKLEESPCPVYTIDFNILEDTPYQPKVDKLADTSGSAPDLVLLPGFQTPQKVAPLQTQQKALQPDVPLMPGVGGCQDLGHSLRKQGDSGVPELVALCAADLRDLWEHSARSNGGARILLLLQKYGSMGPPRLAAAFCSPPMSTPPRPYLDEWPQKKKTAKTEEEHGDASTLSAAQKDPLPTVARTLDTWKLLHDDIERSAHGTLRDLVTDILRSSHLQSERRLPDSKAILKNFPADEREKTLTWLFQVCATVNLQDAVLHMAVLLLDRYCSVLPVPIPLDRLQLVTVAILSISLKMTGAIDENSKPPKLQDLLVHLAQHRFTIQEIFSAEHEVLRFLGFAVAMPTAADLLDTFLVPHGLPEHSEMPSPVRCLAQFLLQLSLLDAPLHYRYSHAVLAAGAVYVALWCTQRGPEHAFALLEDVAVCLDNDTQA